MTNYLFVYGTLRRRSRHPMAQRLADLARFVGPATVAGTLYDLGRYPGLQAALTPQDRVQGDVYDLGDHAERTLREMDAYENGEPPQPANFDRQLAPVTLDEAGELIAWVYWFRGDVQQEQRIASGSYDRS